MGTSHARPHPDAPRIRQLDCHTPGCGRTAVRAGLCGVCRDNFVNRNAVVWKGGELLPQIGQTAWFGDECSDLISESIH